MAKRPIKIGTAEIHTGYFELDPASSIKVWLLAQEIMILLVLRSIAKPLSNALAYSASSLTTQNSKIARHE